MSNGDGYKADVKDIWGVVKICQTSNFGKPIITLKPAKSIAEVLIHFPDTDRVSLSLPLRLEEQKNSKEAYIQLFSENGLIYFESKNQLTAYLDRKNETLGHTITHLYRKLFDASNTDTVNFSVRAVTSDLRPLSLFKRSKYKINPDYEFVAPSARHKGKSASHVQMSRFLNAVSWLLYPSIIILSYKFFGLNVMCLAGLVFFAFFTFYRVIHHKKRISDNWANIFNCCLLLATLVTRDINFLQSIPSAIGVYAAALSGALALGIVKPKSEKDTFHKQKKPKEFILFKVIWVFGGIGMFLINEWTRRHFDIEQWVWFFGFFRLELMIGILTIFTPIYAIFFYQKRDVTDV